MKYFKFLNLKLSTPLLICLVLVPLLMSCTETETHQEDQEPTKEMLAHIIATDKAVNMYQNYETERLAILKDTLNAMYGSDFNDTRRVWFDLKTLKNYIAYVEKKSAENSIEPEGLQFYFSVYGNDEGQQKNQQTFFIAPTTKDNGVQSGYTLETVDQKIQPLFLKNILKKGSYSPTQGRQIDKASFFSVSTTVAEDGLLYNLGTNSPPHDNN